MTTHECGCSFFGPGPHPVDARHRNARGCEHAEQGFTEAELAAAMDEVDPPITGDEAADEDRAEHRAYAAAIFAALGAAQEKGEAG